MNKILYIIFFSLIVTNCSFKPVVKHHGIPFLEKKQEKLIVNSSNKNDIKIFGNPKLELRGSYTIKNFRKDHRVLMMSCVAALTLGGNWTIHDSNSSNTSFPDFFKKIKRLGGVINWELKKI